MVHQASHRFQELFQGLPIACFCFDGEGRIHEWNRFSEHLYGRSACEVLQLPVWKVVCAPSQAGFAQATVKRVLSGETLEGVEWTNVRADGSPIDVLSSTFPLRNCEQAVVGGIIANVDITHRKQAERDLQEAYEKLDHRVQERTEDLAKANTALHNEVAERKRAEAALRADADRLAAVISVQYEIAQAELDLEKVMQLLSDRTCSLSRADRSSILLLDDEDLVMRASSGPAVFPIGTRLKTSTNFASHCVRTGEIVYCPDVRIDSRADQKMARKTKTRSLVAVPIRFGSEIAGVFVVTSCKLDAFEESDVQVLQLMAGLISTAMEHASQFEERRETESELQRILAQTEQVLISIPSILIEIDEKDVITTWNTSAKTAFGLSRDDVLGKRLEECGLSWDSNVLAEAVAACKKEGRVIRLEDVRYTHAEGKERLLTVTITPITTSNGATIGLLILASDVTDRRALEGQLTQSQKLESIGQLAAGIAHEINTPIQYIGDNTRFLKDAFADLLGLIEACQEFIQNARDTGVSAKALSRLEEAAQKADISYLMQEVPAAISQSLDGTEHVAHIVRAMKEFSHPGTTEKTSIDLNHALESTVTVARNEWKYIANVEMDLDPSLPLVSCLPGDLNQVFLNLIVNAAHAVADVVKEGTDEKGTITIRTCREADCVRINIEDTGTGVPEAIRSRLFDPFFTTKGVGKGTGQGLSIARSVIVDRHGGSIEFETEINKGTAFIIRLPL